MYIATKSGDVATKEQKVVQLKKGEQIPKDTSAATIKRWLDKGIIEKVSQKTEAPENKSLEAPEVKSGRGKGKGKAATADSSDESPQE